MNNFVAFLFYTTNAAICDVCCVINDPYLGLVTFLWIKNFLVDPEPTLDQDHCCKCWKMHNG